MPPSRLFPLPFHAPPARSARHSAHDIACLAPPTCIAATAAQQRPPPPTASPDIARSIALPQPPAPDLRIIASAPLSLLSLTPGAKSALRARSLASLSHPGLDRHVRPSRQQHLRCLDVVVLARPMQRRLLPLRRPASDLASAETIEASLADPSATSLRQWACASGARSHRIVTSMKPPGRPRGPGAATR